MQRIDNAERRRRVAVRQHLAPACWTTDVAKVAGDLVGIHATDPASVYLGAWARMSGLTHELMAEALYVERSVLKVLGMRRTMFVAPRDLAGVINSGAARAIAVNERRRTVQMLEGAGVADDVPAWLSQVEAQTVEALNEMGEATAAQLTKRVEGLRVQIAFGEGKKWAGRVGVSTRMLFLLAAEGRVIRGRPRGTWLSSLYSWAPMERWIGGQLVEPPVAEAQADLVRRWLGTYGPGTLRDIKWWTGWTMAATRRALATIGALEVELEEDTGFALAGDTDSTPDPGPWIALLPALDTTTMAWAERSWYLGQHGPRLFDRNGNAGPSIWADGRIVGGFAQRKSGEVIVRLFEDVGTESTQQIEARAAELQRWLGPSRIIPRFRTPTEVELAA